jgi:hypothetical protein
MLTLAGGSADNLLDGAVEDRDCVVDLVLDGRGRIPWDNLKQVWIASDHDERIGRPLGHPGVQKVAETDREPSQLTSGVGDGILAVHWAWGYVPVCYYAAVDENDGRCVILLQDLTTARRGWSTDACSPADIERAIQAIDTSSIS